jgi:hypothetical protein
MPTVIKISFSFLLLLSLESLLYEATVSEVNDRSSVMATETSSLPTRQARFRNPLILLHNVCGVFP